MMISSGKEVLMPSTILQTPNILCSSSAGASQLFKGMMWAANASKIGYKWGIGDGRKVRIWEDNWIGNSNLAIQYWDLYIIVNE